MVCVCLYSTLLSAACKWAVCICVHMFWSVLSVCFAHSWFCVFVLILVNNSDLEYSWLFKYTSAIRLFPYTQLVFACVCPALFCLHTLYYFPAGRKCLCIEFSFYRRNIKSVCLFTFRWVFTVNLLTYCYILSEALLNLLVSASTWQFYKSRFDFAQLLPVNHFFNCCCGGWNELSDSFKSIPDLPVQPCRFHQAGGQDLFCWWCVELYTAHTAKLCMLWSYVCKDTCSVNVCTSMRRYNFQPCLCSPSKQSFIPPD